MTPSRNPWLLVDGWNLLLALLEREGAEPTPAARDRLTELLETWAVARRRRVALVWDGARSGTAPGGSRVRVVHVEPPAEADDWIVLEARRLAAGGVPPEVATRDRGLARRLPEAVRLYPFGDLVADLEALVSEPLTAPHVTGPAVSAELPVGRGPVDPRSLPRRRALLAGTSAVGQKRALASPEPPSEREARARAAARRRREERRQRWERAQARREAARRKKR